MQAGLALRACILALEDALAPSNAFQILALAAEVRSQRLLAKAAAVALLHFAEAVRADAPGFTALPRDLLGRLLSHDCLQVRAPAAPSHQSCCLMSPSTCSRTV